MKKITLSILALTLVFALGTLVVQAKKSPELKKKQLIAANPKDNSKVVSKDFKVSNFETVDVKGGLTVVVKQGSNPKVTATLNQNSMGKLLVKVTNNTLTIRTADKYNPSHAQIIVSAPNIKNINSSGAATVKANQFKSGYLRVSGHNTSTIVSTGSVQKLFVNCDGKSFLNLHNLRSQDCVAVVADKACAKLYASKTLKATTSGQSVLNVKGNPKVIKKDVSQTSFFKLAK